MRRALLAAALLAGTVVLTLAAGPARAAAISQCGADRGSIVAVDFAHFGGPLLRGCGVTASGAPDASGLALLEDGGFTPVGTRQYGLAFICRLGNAAFGGGADYPTDDPCDQTPPASASWSFWLAKPGATSWTYSPNGVTADKPVAGEVELWTFGSTSDPAPSSELIGELRATNTTTAPSSASPSRRPTTAPTAAVHPTTLAPAPSTTSDRAATVLPGPTGSAATAPASSSRSASPAGTTSRTSAATGAPPSEPPIVDAAAAPAAHRSSGSPLPVIVAAVLVVLLGGGAGAAAWRRRRA